MKYVITLPHRAYGDSMLGAQFTANLIANGFDAVFHAPWLRDIVDLPQMTPAYGSALHYEFSYHPERLLLRNMSIIEKSLERFQVFAELLKPLKVKVRTAPVKYVDIPGIPAVDVALNTQIRVSTEYRQWPYFGELKQLLTQVGISFVDLDANKYYGIAALNYIKKARLYVGMDTGMSHYAASTAAGKALILQSGYNTPEYWSTYDYEYAFLPLGCAPCFRIGNCSYGHRCMRELGLEFVFNLIQDRMALKRKEATHA